MSERKKVLITIDADLLAELDALAERDGRDRSHEIEALIKAEAERRARKRSTR